MPKTLGTKGNTVTYEMLGVADVINKLNQQGKMILNNTDVALVRVAAFMQEELKESIAGFRNEMKSVDTGNFLNSIEVIKLKDREISITTDVEYAKFLEFGTSKLLPRYHFTNTLQRNKAKVEKEVQEAVDKATK